MDLFHTISFFDAFVRSVNSIQPVSIAAWQQEWEQIEAVIASMDLNLPGYATDKKEIDERLHAGEYVGHHSERFETSYSPRYRIISRHIFETEFYLFCLQPVPASNKIT